MDYTTINQALYARLRAGDLAARDEFCRVNLEYVRILADDWIARYPAHAALRDDFESHGGETIAQCASEFAGRPIDDCPTTYLAAACALAFQRVIDQGASLVGPKGRAKRYHRKQGRAVAIPAREDHDLRGFVDRVGVEPSQEWADDETCATFADLIELCQTDFERDAVLLRSEGASTYDVARDLVPLPDAIDPEDADAVKQFYLAAGRSVQRALAAVRKRFDVFEKMTA